MKINRLHNSTTTVLERDMLSKTGSTKKLSTAILGASIGVVANVTASRPQSRGFETRQMALGFFKGGKNLLLSCPVEGKKNVGPEAAGYT